MKAEERAAELVEELLATERADASERLPDQVMRTARWQYASRGALLTASQIVAALTDGARLMIGSRRDDR